MNLVTAHLTRLTDFAGRENRQPFWLWILTIYIVQMILSFIITIPLTMQMMRAMEPMMEEDQTYLNQHPEIATRVMMQAMVPFMRNIMIFSAVAGVLFLALIAAAVVRRLHDGNRSGWWAAPMLVLQIATPIAYLAVIPRFFEAVSTMGPQTSPEQANAAMAAVMPSFALVGLLGMIGFVMMVVLIVLLALRGTVGPNRYGPDLLPPPVVWQAPPPQWQPPAPPPPARVVGPWDNPPPPR